MLLTQRRVETVNNKQTVKFFTTNRLPILYLCNKIVDITFLGRFVDTVSYHRGLLGTESSILMLFLCNF